MWSIRLWRTNSILFKVIQIYLNTFYIQHATELKNLYNNKYCMQSSVVGFLTPKPMTTTFKNTTYTLAHLNIPESLADPWSLITVGSPGMGWVVRYQTACRTSVAWIRLWSVTQSKWPYYETWRIFLTEGNQHHLVGIVWQSVQERQIKHHHKHEN